MKLFLYLLIIGFIFNLSSCSSPITDDITGIYEGSKRETVGYYEMSGHYKVEIWKENEQYFFRAQGTVYDDMYPNSPGSFFCDGELVYDKKAGEKRYLFKVKSDQNSKIESGSWIEINYDFSASKFNMNVSLKNCIGYHMHILKKVSNTGKNK